MMICLISLNLTAQEGSCSFKLKEAESLYETGILDSIPAMLRSCINDHGFDKEELARAYKLLILTYQFEDYTEMAELTMLKFLKDFPEYELKATDPIEFKYLYNSYQTIPTFSIGIIGGLNYSMPRIIQPFSTTDTENYKGEYKPGFNFQVGIQLKKYITDEIDINLDAIWTLKTFDYEIQQIGGYTTNYSESLSMFSFPLSGTYTFKMGTLDPYVRLGLNVDYLYAAKADFERIRIGEEDVKDSGIDILEDRNSINISALAGGGIKWNIKLGYIMFDVRYHYSFMNLVNGENRDDDLKTDKYYYKDDDFTLNNLYLSVGYVHSFYKTKQHK